MKVGYSFLHLSTDWCQEKYKSASGSALRVFVEFCCVLYGSEWVPERLPVVLCNIKFPILPGINAIKRKFMHPSPCNSTCESALSIRLYNIYKMLHSLTALFIPFSQVPEQRWSGPGLPDPGQAGGGQHATVHQGEHKEVYCLFISTTCFREVGWKGKHVGL